MLSRTVPDFQYSLGDCLVYEMITDVDMLHANVDLVILGYCDG